MRDYFGGVVGFAELSQPNYKPTKGGRCIETRSSVHITGHMETGAMEAHHIEADDCKSGWAVFWASSRDS